MLEEMRKTALLAVMAGLSFACSLLASAQDKGPWHSTSSNANAITGDIGIFDDKLSLNFATFTMAEIRKLDPAEAAALFSTETNAPGGGFLYRMDIPATKHFVHKNTLCGNEDTQWMATWVAGRDLHVALFSGGNTPVMTSDALANSTDVCGLFLYSR
jgi:hypothetical protein